MLSRGNSLSREGLEGQKEQDELFCEVRAQSAGSGMEVECDGIRKDRVEPGSEGL